MTYDLALTATGAPAVLVGPNRRYPLVMTIAGMKEWAEYRGATFEDVLAGGWNVAELSGADMERLLKICLVGGERRRALFDDGLPREITDETVAAIMEMAHPQELLTVLIAVWNQPPARELDPPRTEASSPTGE